MMSSQGEFLTVSQFADLCGISRRNATKALARGYGGQTWNNYRLAVREVPGRGGRSGTHYEVALSSLPVEVQTRWTPAADITRSGRDFALLSALATRDAQDWRFSIVSQIAAAGPPGSPARVVALSAVVAVATFREGKRAGKPVGQRTIRAWVAEYERRGQLSTIRASRADRGKSRVIAWREWDRAMAAAGVPGDRQREIARSLGDKVRSFWASGVSSVANIQLLMQRHCQAAAEGAGLCLDRAAMDALCRPPAHFVGQKDRKRARLAHTKRTDAGGYAADLVSRVRRHREDLKPLDMVAADVRHSDIMVRRPDGSLATPKVVAFLDLATNRLFTSTFLMPKGEMIRREHVLIALRDLMADPSWGVPRQLYIDNGSEFRIGMAADDLASLAALVRDAHGIELGVFDGAAPAALTGTVRSRPYNPQSKVIESTFSNFTRSIEPMYPGFVGGNRMAKKVENQGRAPVPMGGDAQAIQDRFRGMVDFYNAKPQQRGHIKGRSPDAAFTTAVEAGWQAVIFNPREFELAFGVDVSRVVQTGGELEINRRHYRHDALAPMAGERVQVRVPILGDGARVTIINDKGEPLCVAAEAPRYGMRDLAGVREHDRRRRDLSARIKAAADGTERLDLSAENAAYVQSIPRAPAPASLATASIHPVLHQAAAEAEGAPSAALAPRASKVRSQFAAAAALLRAG